MAPSQLPNKLLDRCSLRRNFGKDPHVKEVRVGEPFHIRKLTMAIGRQAINNLHASGFRIPSGVAVRKHSALYHILFCIM